MEHATFERLRALNHEFYQTFAERFADKRARLQPGVLHALSQYPPGEKILDLGCGHGSLAQHLINTGYKGWYLGLDLSDRMIDLAREIVKHGDVTFVQVDLSLPSWRDALQSSDMTFTDPYSTVYSFASLHHIPGEERRQQLVREVFDLMQPEALWVLSVWDFMRSNRLRKRILPWESVGIDPGEVEDGDYLIDWRHGGQGLRYVHHFSVEELERLATSAGFEVLETFQRDGEGGLLGLYQVWKKP